MSSVKPLNVIAIKRNLTSSQPQNTFAMHSRLISKKSPESVKTEKFVPSPELIIDSSQSSESNEKIVINKNHQYVIPVS